MVKDKIKNLFNQHSYFDLDDEGDDFINYTTRENGNVGDEEIGIKDWQEGVKMKTMLKSIEGIKEIELDTFDEWVYINIYLM